MKRSRLFGALVLVGMLTLGVTAIVVAQQEVKLTTLLPAPLADYARLSVTGDPPIAPATVADPDPTVDVTIGTAAAGAITQNGTVQINGNVTIGQAGDGANRDRSLTVSGNATVGDPNTPTTSSVVINGQLTVDDRIPGLGNVVAQHDVTIGRDLGAGTGDAVLNVWGQIRRNNALFSRGFPPPDFDSATANMVTQVFGETGPRTADGWIPIGTSSLLTIVHGFVDLNLNYIVYIEGRNTAGIIHQRNFGGDTTVVTLRGIQLFAKGSGSIQINRFAGDTDWNQIRVRLWRW